MNKGIDKKINITFEKLKSYDVGDTRFTDVKIWLMHLGKNLNGSVFNEEPTKNAIPSLSNTPILGYIEKNNNNEDDFSDHREVLEIKDKTIKIKYKGTAFGVIPESNDAKFENKICQDGIERTFLTCKGLMWNKFEDGIDILNRDGCKDESMELADEYSGHFDKEGYFVFDQFFFNGACILGGGTQPAMTGACVDINFSIDEIKSKIELFQNYIKNQLSNDDIDINNSFQKGGNDKSMNSELITNILAEFNLTLEELDFEITEDLTEEILRNKLTEFTNSKKEKFEKENNKGESEPELSFSATYRQKREVLSNLLPRNIVKDASGSIIEETYCWLSDFDDKYVYVEKSIWTNDNYTSENGRYSYTFDDVNLSAELTSDFEEMIVTWVTIAENAALQEMRSNYELQTKEFESLKQFKTDVLKEQRSKEEEKIFSKFDENLYEVEAYKQLKENCSDLSIEQIEEKCFSLVGRFSTNFTKKKDDENLVKLAFEQHEDVEDDGYGGLLAKAYKN